MCKSSNRNDPEHIGSILRRVVSKFESYIADSAEPPKIVSAVTILRRRRGWSVAEIARASNLSEFEIEAIEVGAEMDAGQKWALWAGFNQYHKRRHHESGILQPSLWRVRRQN